MSRLATISLCEASLLGMTPGEDVQDSTTQNIWMSCYACLELIQVG